MNPLLQVTKSEILERQAFGESFFPDDYILSAIEAYDNEGSVKRRAEGFVMALTPLWAVYRKQGMYESLFTRFIEHEIGLEAISLDHSSHVNHVIQEFLFGYNVLTNCEYLKTEYRFEVGRNESESQFGRLFFSWMAASLLHDVGYDIERAPEEEAFREKKNDFWDFMTRREITDNPLQFRSGGDGPRMIQDYILPSIVSVPGAPDFSYVEFERLFLRPVPGRGGRGEWTRYDHGIISAVKYFVELERLQHERGGDYLEWPPNRQAALAMALHNFRYKECDLRLSCANPQTLVAYLLIVSDEIQEWERDRVDADAYLPDSVTSGKNARKTTELVGVVFRNDRAFVVVNHILKDSSLRGMFEEYLDEKILLLKKHYPIRVPSPQWRRRDLDAATASPAAHHRIARVECEKHLLVSSQPRPIYEISVDHRIDGESYLAVVFPL